MSTRPDTDVGQMSQGFNTYHTRYLILERKTNTVRPHFRTAKVDSFTPYDDTLITENTPLTRKELQ